MLKRLTGRVLVRAKRSIARRLPDAKEIEIRHLPARFGHRSNDFTANVWGYRGMQTRDIRYRLNNTAFSVVSVEPPRVGHNTFVIELPVEACRKGTNELTLEVVDKRGNVRHIQRSFQYDPEPPALPLVTDWRSDLDSADGFWETVDRDGVSWVRPIPGLEDYDRVIVAAPAFAAGRRVMATMLFRGQLQDKPFGFGLLPLWGGRPDRDGHTPRRGWCFAISNYYSGHGGVGMEFSYRDGGADPAWAGVYRGLDIEPGQTFEIVAEAWPEFSPDGKHYCFRQRTRWSTVGGEAGPWMELSDIQGAPLPCRDYGVAVIAHQCQIECGPVRIEPIVIAHPAQVATAGVSKNE
jgi:hypothetical protein